MSSVDMIQVLTVPLILNTKYKHLWSNLLEAAPASLLATELRQSTSVHISPPARRRQFFLQLPQICPILQNELDASASGKNIVGISAKPSQT